MASNTVASTLTGFSRCAVCKIDLKGRFVYVDSEVERILGYTEEELIGKSLFEFLDQSSNELMENLLTCRNHYEKFYDTTYITIINRNKKKKSVRLVASLNFISGNPVNYQLILDTYHQPDSIIEIPTKRDRSRNFIEKLANLEKGTDIEQYLPILKQFSEASMVCLYKLDDNQLELISTAPFNTIKDKNHSKALKTGKFYYDIYENDTDYSYSDRNKVAEAIEIYGHAPDEFVTTLTLNTREKYLIRFIFNQSTDHRKVVRSEKNIRNSIKILKHLDFKSDEDNESITFQFTIGLLEVLGVSAFTTDESGEINGYNLQMTKFVDEKKLTGSYLTLLNNIIYDGTIITNIIDYVTSSYNDDVNSHLKEKILLENGTSVNLNIVKLSDRSLDLTCLFIFSS